MTISKTIVGPKSELPAVTLGPYQVAALFDISRPVISELTSAGILPRVAMGKYDMAAVTKAYVAHLRRQMANSREGADFQESRAGLYEERRRLAELERERVEGSLVSLDMVEAFVGGLLSVLRTRILGAPRKLAVQLAATRRPLDAENVLDTELRSCLEAVTVDRVMAAVDKRRLRRKATNGHVKGKRDNDAERHASASA